MLKAGDIVRIKKFEPGSYGGVYYNRRYTEREGEIHLVRMADPRDNTCLLDTASSDNWWSVELLERIEDDLEEYKVFSTNRLIQPVHYDQASEAWYTEDGRAQHWDDIWLGHSEKEELPYDIYRVGVRGSAVDVINIGGLKYLAPKYLPMFGII